VRRHNAGHQGLRDDGGNFIGREIDFAADEKVITS
jgi:hypothetical protein